MSESIKTWLFGSTGGKKKRRKASGKQPGPTPSDKYLPAWVISSMTAAIVLLSWQMTSAITNICAMKGRCADAKYEPPSANGPPLVTPPDTPPVTPPSNNPSGAPAAVTPK